MALRSLFVDFNSYFASVEQQERPELRGRPIAVLPVMSDSTCCIAASYEAKKFGIKTGTNAGKARQMCPGILLVEGRQELYVKYHHELVKIVDSCMPVSEIRSIDEMSCALVGRWQDRATAWKLAHEIKGKIAARYPFMSSSIGIGPNSFLAKTASDMQKPDGLVVLEESDLPGALFRLKLRDFCGIGEAREERLHACGIHTVEQLCLAQKGQLRKAWKGIEGERIFALLRGEEIERPPTQRCTVGHSHVLEPKYRTMPLAEAVLHRLLQKAAARMRSLGYLAGRLAVSVKFLSGQRWGDEIGFRETQDTIDLIRAFDLVWQGKPGGRPPLAVSVTLFHLTAAHNVTPLLPQFDSMRLALHQAVDRLNTAYGKNTVFFGGAQTALDSAPSRIAFTHIPQPEPERVVLRKD